MSQTLKGESKDGESRAGKRERAILQTVNSKHGHKGTHLSRGENVRVEAINDEAVSLFLPFPFYISLSCCSYYK